jgi:hypothetical protein
MHNIKSITQKDRYGNMFSLELFEDQGVPLMIMIPDAPDGFNGADTSNHPGDPKGTDTVPAWLTPGENVVNAEASRIPGNQEKIDKMNEEGRKIQKAQGGPIPTYAADGVEVDDKLLAAIRQVESGGDDRAVSRVGAAGPYQIMADTALQPGYGVPPISLEDRFNPNKSKEFARRYLEGIAAANPDFTREQLITAYHSGPGNVAKGNIGPQGQSYFGKVMSALNPISEAGASTLSPETNQADAASGSKLFDLDQIKRAAQYPLEMFGFEVPYDAPGVPTGTLFGNESNITRRNAQQQAEADLEQLKRFGQYPLEYFGLPVDEAYAAGVPYGTIGDSALVKAINPSGDQVELKLNQQELEKTNTKLNKETVREQKLLEKINTLTSKGETVPDSILKQHQEALANVNDLKNKQSNLSTYISKASGTSVNNFNTKTGFVNRVIQETDTGDLQDQPESDADTNNNVVQAGVDIKNNNPGFFKETTDLFLEVLGDMFPPKDLARMVINYAGSRALGYDHNGSLNYTMKDYATRAELERVRQAKFVNDNEDLYTPESLNEYLKSGDIDVLVTKTETSGGITGQSGTRFDRLTGLEVPVYTIGTGDNKRLVTQDSNGQLLDLSDTENRIRFEVMNDSVHNPTKVTSYFQKAIDNRAKEINRTIDDGDKQIDFATDELAGESYLLYEKTRNTFGMDTKQSQRLKNEIVAAQGDYLKAIKSAKENGTREPTSLEGYYNKRVISLKTKGIISYNDVKNTSASNMDQLEQTLLNIAADAANGDQRLAVKTYRDLWSSGKETWNNMKSKGRFTEGKTEGYDPFIAWMQAVVVGDETATKLEDPSNMKK